MKNKHSFWSTIPGLIASVFIAIAAFIILLIALFQSDILDFSNNKTPKNKITQAVKKAPETSKPSIKQRHSNKIKKIEQTPISQQRNPFKTQNVPDPEGKDVLNFSRHVVLTGKGKDENAYKWNARAKSSIPNTIEGFWKSRKRLSSITWNKGSAEIKIKGKWVYILFKNSTDSYLFQAKQVGLRKLVGRYVNLTVQTDSSPWVGLIVNKHRIDGVSESGRWDFRR